MKPFLRKCAIRLSKLNGERDFDGNQGLSPEFFSDSDNVKIYKIERILLAALLTSPIMWAYTFLSYFLMNSDVQWKIGMATSMIHMVSPLLLLVGVSADWTISILLAMGLLHQASFSMHSGGFTSIIVVWFGVLPLIAGVTGGLRLAKLWLGISSLAALVFLIAELSGYQFQNLIGREGFLLSHILLVFGMIFLGGALTSILAASATEREQQLSTQVGWVKNLVKVLCHDISNPLTVILARNQLLQTNPNDPDKRAKATFLIHDAATQIQNITKSVRDLYGLEYGKRKLPVKPVSVLEAISNALTAINEKAESKKVEITLEQFSDVMVLADPTALSIEIITNILSNAIKFSDPQSKIKIKVDETHTNSPWVAIRIRDYGIGIPDSILKDIFSLGSPTSRTGTSGESGTGFGMPIVKNYIEAMGGKIQINSTTIESNPIDHGTEMVLHLRKATDSSQPT